MVSTVTTTVTTVVSTATIAVAAGLSLFSIITLLGILAARELTTVGDAPRQALTGRILDIATCPLLIGFIVITIVKVIQALN
jgi:hypothetical protein